MTSISTSSSSENGTTLPPTKLFQLVTRMDTGGVPEHVVALLSGLSQKNYQITLVCREVSERYRAKLESLGVRIVLLDLRRLISPIADIRAAWKLYRLLRQERCDVLHMHMSKAALLGGVVGWLARVPVRVNTAHNLGCIALPQRALRALFWMYDKFLFTSMHAVITVSTRIREAIIQLKVLPAEKAHAIPNGIDVLPFAQGVTARSDTRSALALKDGEVAIGTVARLVWFKGLDALIESMPEVLRAHPQTRFFIVGDGPLKAQLIERAVQLGVAERLVFLGERNDIPSLLAAFDIFVLPSVSEGMPITILEAMAAGKPIVATDVGGVGEMIIDQSTGLLVPARKPSILARALSLLSVDPAKRKQMGEAASQHLLHNFSQESMVSATDRLYQNHLKGRTS